MHSSISKTLNLKLSIAPIMLDIPYMECFVNM